MGKKVSHFSKIYLSYSKNLPLLILFIFVCSQTTYSQTSALTFNGVDSYVQLSELLTIGNTSNTVEIWVKVPLVETNNLASNERVGIMLGNYDSANDAGWEIHDDGQIRMWWNGNPDVFGPTDLRDNTWHHIAFVRDKTNDKLLGYVDGNLEFEYPDSGIDLTFTTTHRIGKDNRSSGSPHFHGEMDEIRIWNTARSQTEIRENMFKELAGNESGLVHYYKMSNGSGSTLTDNSTNSNSGTVYTATWSKDAFVPNGDGTSGNPYQIASITNLLWISENTSTWSSHLEQNADIDASYTANLDDANGGDKEGFHPIGTSTNKFTGAYDGGGYSIQSLYVKRSSIYDVGLFGYFEGEYISNVNLINIDISGYRNTGGLVGNFSSNNTLANCSTTGSVSGNVHVGGLVGYQDIGTTIHQSYSTATVNSSGYGAGGLIGGTSSIINYSYATGSINGNIEAGGLIGIGYSGSVISNSYATGAVSASYGGGLFGSLYEGTVNNTYSTGSVTGDTDVGGLIGYAGNTGISVSNSFWDTETSGQPASRAGTGKTTNEMKFFHTFFDAGWDLEVETTNGTNNYWDLDDGSLNDGYPILSWQQTEVNLAQYSSDINGSEGWRLISSPVYTSFSELLEPIWTQGSSDADWSGGTPNVYTWDNSATSTSETFWNEVTSLNKAISEGTGFLVNVYADDDYDGTDELFPKTLNIIGVEPSGTVSPTLNTNSDGWTLLGNPFSGTLDFDTMPKSNLTNVVYVLKNDGSGSYISWNGSIGDVTDGLISSFQGFFVQNVSSPASPSLTFDSSLKLKQQPSDSERIAVRLQIEGENMSNSVWLQFSEEGDYKQQVMGDALELTPLNSQFNQLAAQKGNKLFDIAHLPGSSESKQTNYEIPLDISSTVGGIFVLTATDIELPQNMEVTFLDSKTGYKELISEDFSYEINLEAAKEKTADIKLNSAIPLLAKATAGNRFILTVYLSENSFDEIPGNEIPTTVALNQNYPNPFNPTTNIQYQLPETSNVSLAVYDLTGRMVTKLIEGEIPAGTHTVHFDASNLSSGVYIYRLATKKNQLTRKLTLIK